MNPEEKELLKKTLELARENNRMLHSIKRQMLWGRIFRIVYWVLIIGAAIGLYYYIDPYINDVISAYASLKGNVQDFGNLFR
jgi:hypothetical protein